MPTSAREAVTNSPKIFVKTVRSAGPMWASAPTNVLGSAYGFALGFRKKHCFQRADRVVGSYRRCVLASLYENRFLICREGRPPGSLLFP